MRTFLPVAAVALAASVAATLPAQTCLGNASFAAGPVRGAGSVATATGVTTYGLSAAAGHPIGAFGSAEIDRSEFSDIEASAREVKLAAGYAVNASPTSTVQFCPRVLFDLQSGPDFNDGFDSFSSSSHVFGFGGAVAGDLPVSPTLHFVPALALAFEAENGTLTVDGQSASTSSNFGEADFAAGFVLNRKLTIRPAVLVPLGVSGATSIAELSIGYNFGTAHTPPTL